MNTSSIHALAIAAEARANEDKAELRRVSIAIASSGIPVAAAFPNDNKASPNVDAATKALPPLPALPAAAAASATATHEDNPAAAKPKQGLSVGQPPSRRKPTFAEKLHGVLANKNLQHIITWLPSGKSFCILDKDRFTTQVLPAYFRQAKFESFSRRIKRWGFKKMHTTGSKQVVYTHEYFRKNQIDLCSKMNGRADQVETSDAIADATKYENILTEQVALAEKTLGAYHDDSAKEAKTKPEKRQMPMKKRFVPSHTMPGAVTRQLPSAMNYEPASMSTFLRQCQMNEMQLQQQQMSMGHFKMNQMNMMSNFHPQVNGMNRNFRANGINPSMTSSMMYSQGALHQDMARQLNKLDEDIAECEEQLIILQRLKALKQRRAMGC